MTHIEQAIEEAVGAGYKPEQLDYQRTDTEQFAEESYRISYSKCFLDPLFWQALGKARGWDGKHTIKIRGEPLSDWRKTPIYYWHRFIDHLIAGKNAESFFKDLSPTPSERDGV